MARLAVPWSFYDAATSLPDWLPYNARHAVWNRGRELTRGELGCFASHVSLWKWLSEHNDLNSMCVLEDDVLINWSFFEKAGEFDASFNGFNFVRFYGKLPVSTRCIAPVLGRYLVEYRRPVYGTQGYWINKAGAKLFLSSIQKVVRPIDDEMDRVWAHGVPSLGLYPAPLTELDFGSTIEMDRRLDLPALRGSDRIMRLLARAAEKARRIAFYAGIRWFRPRRLPITDRIQSA